VSLLVLFLFVPFRSAVNWTSLAWLLIQLNSHDIGHDPPADAPFTPAPRLQPSLQLAVAERGCVRAVFISVHGESMFPAARGTGAYVCLETFQREGRGAKRTRSWLAVCQRSLPTSVPVRRTPAADASARSRNRDSTLPRISSRSSHCCQSTPEL